MLTTTRLAASLLLLLSFFHLSLLAQEKSTNSSSTPVVTATATGGRVRYVSIGEVHQTRLQVFSSDGIPVFDSSYKDGNLIDWQLTDQQGSRVKDGSYLFLVTIKDFSGRTTQKYGTTVIEREQVYLEQTQRASLSQAQSTALEASKESEALSPIDRMGAAELNRLATVPATGAVAAVPASSSKVEQSSATSASTTNPSAEAVAGTGSQNSITKWTDNTGTLGDSSIYEANGKIGIGTTTPREGLTVYSPTGTAKYIMSEWGGGGSVSFGGDNSNGPFLLSHTDSEGRATGNYTASRIRFGASGFLFDTSPVTPVGETRSWLTRAILDASGRFGLGIDTPTEKLDVAGNVKIRGAGNGIVFPDGTVQTTASGSGSMTGSSIIGAINAPTTTGTINDNRLSSNVARLNSANTFNGNQIVNGNVGIGTASPTSKLQVAGTVESTSGGFKFPDGSVQATSAGKLFYSAQPLRTEIAPKSLNYPWPIITKLDVPAGTYLVFVSLYLKNEANLFAQDNRRTVMCELDTGFVTFDKVKLLKLDGYGNTGDTIVATWHAVVTLDRDGIPIKLRCQALDGGSDRSWVFADEGKLSAIKMGEATHQF